MKTVLMYGKSATPVLAMQRSFRCSFFSDALDVCNAPHFDQQ
jgi:hypothetical protein